MKSVALALVVAALAGCAIVPVPFGPPVVVGARVDYGGHYGYGRPYYGGGGYWRR